MSARLRLLYVSAFVIALAHGGHVVAQAPSQSEIDRLAAEAQQLIKEGKYRDALPLLQRSVQLLDQAGRDQEPTLSAALFRLGSTFLRAGIAADAIKHLERALQISERHYGRTSPQSSSILTNLATAYRAQGDLIRSESLYLELLTLQEKANGPTHPSVGRLLANLASLYDLRRDFARAEPIFKRAIAIFEANTTPLELAQVLNGLANLYQNRGDLNAATPLFERSLEVRRSITPPNPALIAVALANLASNFQERGELTRATPLYDEALANWAAVKASDTPAAATILLNKAMIALLGGDHTGAGPLYQRAIAIRESALGRDHPDTGGALERQAVFFAETDRPAEAFEALRRSAEIAELNLAATIESGSEDQKLAYMTTLQENTDIIASMRRTFASQDAAFTPLAISAIVQRKGRVLETVVKSAERLRQDLDPRGRQIYDELSQARAALAKAALAAPSPSRDTEIRQLRDDIDRRERELAAVSAEARIQLRPVTADDVLRKLPADSAVIEYVKYSPFDPKAIGRFNRFLPPQYAAIVLRAGGRADWIELGPADAIDTLVGAWRTALMSPRANTTAREGRLLSDALIAPITSRSPLPGHLYVVPDDVLNLVPFGALPMEGGRYLLERTDVSYLSSSREILKLGAATPAREPALIVAAPALDTSAGSRGSGPAFSPLPGAAKEGALLAGLIPQSKLVTAAAATETAVKEARGPVVLHFATHAFFVGPQQTPGPPPGNRGLTLTDRVTSDSSPLLRAGIVLANAGRAGSAVDDGILTALEAVGLDLRGTKIVTLSACETGLGEVRAGDGVHGFRRALAVAGAESLVLTLWRIDDASTSNLVADFYRAIRDGAGRSEALRRAQIAALRRPGTSHPYYWAAFVLAGETAPMQLEIRPRR